MKYVDYDITFSEVPGETCLTFSISGCGMNCADCHSPWLQEDIGEELTVDLLSGILDKYSSFITCVCFLGGQQDEIKAISSVVKRYNKKICWYTGKTYEPISVGFTDYLKVGSYQREFGGLRSQKTNQRFFAIKNNIAEDITAAFFARQ